MCCVTACFTNNSNVHSYIIYSYSLSNLLFVTIITTISSLWVFYFQLLNQTHYTVSSFSPWAKLNRLSDDALLQVEKRDITVNNKMNTTIIRIQSFSNLHPGHAMFTSYTTACLDNIKRVSRAICRQLSTQWVDHLTSPKTSVLQWLDSKLLGRQK